jgi:hypothetical protein
MGITKAGLSTVQAPNGGGLAIYVDSLTGEVMLKDINGNIEPLSNFIRAYTETTGKSEFYLIEEQDCIKPVSGNNSLLGKNSVILSGEYNINRGEFSVINGGESNTTANRFTVINGGKGNTVDADFGIINGGNANNVNGVLSSVLAGENNNTDTHTNSHIIGSNIVADRDDTTFIENLSITKLPTSSKGLPKNSIWNNKGVLSIV